MYGGGLGYSPYDVLVMYDGLVMYGGGLGYSCWLCMGVG